MGVAYETKTLFTVDLAILRTFQPPKLPTMIEKSTPKIPTPNQHTPPTPNQFQKSLDHTKNIHIKKKQSKTLIHPHLIHFNFSIDPKMTIFIFDPCQFQWRQQKVTCKFHIWNFLNLSVSLDVMWMYFCAEHVETWWLFNCVGGW